MMPMAVKPAPQAESMRSTHRTATTTVAAVSQATRSSSTRFSTRAGSSTSSLSRAAFGTPASTSSAARTRETRDSAASAQAETPATRTSATTARISQNSRALIRRAFRRECPAFVYDCSSSAGPGLPSSQQLLLPPEHLRLLVRLGVVVAEQVQDPVRGEQPQLVGGGVTGVLGLLHRHLRAQHDVPEQAGDRLVVLPGPGRPQPVHWEGPAVGRTRPGH